MIESSRPGRGLRRRRKPSPGVLAAAAAAGVAAEDLLCGDEAGEVAGYRGKEPGKGLAAARKRGLIEGFVAPDSGPIVWYARADLERLRAERSMESPAEPSRRPLTADWMGNDGDPGAPISRVEHELELEVVRLRERLAATEADRDRLAEELSRARAEIERARRVAAALAEAMAATVADPDC